MYARASLILLLLVTWACPACGGAGSPSTDLGSVQDPTTPPAGPLPPDVPAGDPALDVDLLAVLARQDLTPPDAGPARSEALVSLGRALFFDKVLSGNRDIACSTCHHPTEASGDGLSLSIGAGGAGTGSARTLAGGEVIPRNAPPLFNRGRAQVNRMFWDSRVSLRGGGGGPPTLLTPEPALNGARPEATEIVALLDTALAAQALFPLTSAAEMRGLAGENEIADAATNLEAWALLMARLVGTSNGSEGGIPAYRTLFAGAYPEVTDFDSFHIGHVGRAIGAYEQVAFDALATPFDAYLEGDRRALPDAAKRGALLFYGRAQCSRCHGGPLFSDDQHHAIAIPQIGPGKDAPGEDRGRFAVTGDPDDLYAFRTPSLRNTALTGPWMHDGAYTSLARAVQHYANPVGNLFGYDEGQLVPLLRSTVDRDVTRNQARADALSNILRPAPRLAPADVDDLVAFLEALTDPRAAALQGEIPASVPSGLPVGD
jgi:cytochrome c peroxidase